MIEVLWWGLILKRDESNFYFYEYQGKPFTGIMISTSGAKSWLMDGQYHRADGPAVGSKMWALNGTFFNNREEWFSRLTAEQKRDAVWSFDE